MLNDSMTFINFHAHCNEKRIGSDWGYLPSGWRKGEIQLKIKRALGNYLWYTRKGISQSNGQVYWWLSFPV